ncbi:hypothetical protein DICPUDRAFT_151351 [Dictyostelium purpureum]|uniref:Peptidase C1A papain C-terminal domain-containing protein n=1 Tax=Dictyostelium purpureum TaxID=5786 RepID=F0ZIL5_DICPU|nr:uncharacterized protein DICPUDRAFT_151351 [Dictyostelium purpureum]EGC36209.1 hypothetical protein DICPUDRAFT_151351 [Dictyostelium purpureum]|eukprot:XP_003287276.1 hypothetical protein DICPUDRAFT_151351 [Dictyostelium purpureum]
MKLISSLIFSIVVLYKLSYGFPQSYDACTEVTYGDKYDTIPDSYDVRTTWSECISPIREQKSCGSCWAQVSTGLLADKACIQTGGKIKVTLSPQYMMDCDGSCTSNSGCNNGCKGGFVGKAFEFLINNGVVPDTCLSYKASKDDSCPQSCDDGTPFSNQTKFRASSCQKFPTIQDAQVEIMTNGPVVATLMLYDDFKPYKWANNIYVKGENAKTVESHAVRVVGWGKSDSGVLYWIAANSWGSGWGDGGYFKIIRGTDEVGFEEGFITMTSDDASIPSTYYDLDYELGNGSVFLKPSFIIIFGLIVSYFILVPLILS